MERVARQAPLPAGAPKLVLGPADDSYEREADRVARRVRRAGPTASIQRLHGAEGGAVDARVHQAIQGARGKGQPLPDAVRTSMEQALGADLGGVRVHTDVRADQLGRALRAKSFTTGQDIFFRRGEYNSSDAGRDVLAHELTHVVQQSGGSDVIQRRMGFEFETEAHFRPRFAQPNDPTASDLGLFDDDEWCYRHPNASWGIKPDSGRMEFVTDALRTLPELRTASQQIGAFIAGVEHAPRPQDIRAGNNPAAWIAPQWAGNRAFTVHVGSDALNADVRPSDWHGQPQVSVGVHTDAVAAFLYNARGRPLMSGLKREFERRYERPQRQLPHQISTWDPVIVTEDWLSVEALRDVNGLVNKFALNLPPAEQNKLRGLWALMMAYWTHLAVHKTGGYKKKSLQAMARTDFHSYYRALGRQAKDAFALARADFVMWTKNARTSEGEQARVKSTNITLDRWYRSVIDPEPGSTYDQRPVDLLSANTSRTNEAMATDTDASMGQYPLDVAEGPPKVVFEMRHITPRIRIPINLMYERVLRPIFEFVAWAEAGSPETATGWMVSRLEDTDAVVQDFKANVMPNMTHEQEVIARRHLDTTYHSIRSWPRVDRRAHMMMTLRSFASPWL